jgi:hypothetical protein
LLAFPQITSQIHANEYNSGVQNIDTAPLSTRAVVGLEVLCSCVKGVREFIPDLPFGDAADFFPNTELKEGVVAIFWFPPSEKYPQGTKHVAYVDEVIDHIFHIKQTNKQSCAYSEEWVSVDSPYLIGFYEV